MAVDRSTTNVSLGLAGFLILYLLSLPFVAYVFRHSGMNPSDPLAVALEYAYAPCLWLATHFPPYTYYLSITFDALGMDHP